MTAAQTYTVDVVYHGRDQGAQGMADHLGVSLSGLQGRLDTVTSGMERLAMVGVAAIGGVAAMGVRTLARGLFDLHTQAEQTGVAIAGALSVNGAAGGIDDGMRQAGAIMSQIRKDAAALPGEANDYITVFTTALPAALQSGFRSGLDVSRFTNQFGALASTWGIDAAQGGRDLRFMLQGHAGAQVAMWTQLQPIIGKTAEEFNRLSAAERRVALEGAVGRFAPMIGRMGPTMAAQIGTLKENWNELRKTATAPLFEHATAAVTRLNGYIEANGPWITHTLTSWGESAAHGFDAMVDRGTHALDYLRTEGARSVAYLRGHWRELVSEIERSGRSALSVYAGLRAGSAVLGAAQTVGGIAGAARSAGLLGGAGEAGGAASLAAAAPVAVGALLAVGAAGLAIHDGAFDVNAALRDLDPSLRILKSGLGELADATRPLVVAYGSTLLTAITEFAGVVTPIVGGLASVLGTVVRLETEIAHLAIDPWRDFYRGITGSREGPGTANANNVDSAMTDAAMRDHTISYRATATARPGGNAPTNPAARTHHTTINNHFKIEQADNPERVALSVLHVMRRELRNPTQSARPGVARLG